MSWLQEEVAASCRGKNGYLRALILLGLGYILVRTLRDPSYSNVLWPVNLGFHEAGHILFGFCGKFLGILGGTLLECLMPLFGMYHFILKKDLFSAVLCFGWLSTVFFDVARYVADARQMAIPLVSLSWDPEIIHDWNYLLSQWGLLQRDQEIAFLLRALAVGSMLLCLILGFWFVFRMITTRPAPQESWPIGKGL